MINNTNMKVIKKRVLVLMLSLTAITSGYGQIKPDQPFDLYILIGQSNMAGRGPITPLIADEHNDHVYMFTKDKQWVIAKHPLHFDKPASVGVGPGLTFGIAIAKAYPGHNIGLIPCAVGGTAIEYWLPGAFDPATKTHPYDDAVERITAAMKFGSVKGVIWHQGESNSSPEKIKGYLDKLADLIKRVRTVTNNPNLPFVVGELGRYRPVYASINAILPQLLPMVPNTALATSENLVHKGDTTHFDGRSAQELGRRYAVQMLKLQSGKR